jgi:hypothetical protein
LFDALDLTRTVGWFTSLFPVRLGRCEALGSNLRWSRNNCGDPGQGPGLGALRYLGDESVQAELAALPVPRITFNYLGQFDGSLRPRTARCSCRPARPWAGPEPVGGAGQLADAQWPGVRRRVQHGLALQHADVRRSHGAAPGG